MRFLKTLALLAAVGMGQSAWAQQGYSSAGSNTLPNKPLTFTPIDTSRTVAPVSTFTNSKSPGFFGKMMPSMFRKSSSTAPTKPATSKLPDTKLSTQSSGPRMHNSDK